MGSYTKPTSFRSEVTMISTDRQIDIKSFAEKEYIYTLWSLKFIFQIVTKELTDFIHIP